MAGPNQPLPAIVTQTEWQSALEQLSIQEREIMRAMDAVNAERRRLPMVKVEKRYAFTDAADNSNKLSLFDLFHGCRQLIVFHFMFSPDWDMGCTYCSLVADAMAHPAHLRARDTSLVLVSRAPAEKLAAYKRRMGWTVSWYSSFGSDFNVDFGMTMGEDETAGVSVFLRAGNGIYRTYFTTGNGVNHLGSLWTYLDLTPYGRQEDWEDSPEGWPKHGCTGEHRRHDEYDGEIFHE